MKDVIKGYRQIIAGIFAFVILAPALFTIIFTIVLFGRAAWSLIVWTWGLW